MKSGSESFLQMKDDTQQPDEWHFSCFHFFISVLQHKRWLPAQKTVHQLFVVARSVKTVCRSCCQFQAQAHKEVIHQEELLQLEFQLEFQTSACVFLVSLSAKLKNLFLIELSRQESSLYSVLLNNTTQH